MPLDERVSSPPTPGKRPLVATLGRVVASAFVAMAVLVSAGAAANAGKEPAEPVEGRALFDPSFTHGRVLVENNYIHYVRGGSGPPLVLLHGWPQTWATWRGVMPALAQNHTVIAFDLPGLGDSGAPASGYDKVTTAQRIRTAVHALGYQTIDILAHDVGSLVAYPYARDYPTEVRRMAVIEAPLSGFGLEGAYGLSWHFLFNASPAPIPETIIDNGDDVRAYLGMIFDGSPNPAAIDRDVYFRAYSDPADRAAGYKYYRAFAGDAVDNQTYAESRRLTMPVLAMGGQYVFGAGVAASFRAVAGDVREVVAPNAGHFINEENPQFLIDCANLFFGPAGVPVPVELAACAP